MNGLDEPPVLAQRAGSEGPRWMRAVGVLSQFLA